ncbi:hypothetical protein CFP56_032839 [Quercus suber]|uniref:Uncharacterized protein n=1 Tax=Quercus suber TaxID=58331 RepID=A0AAW0LS07_QUESU
MKGSLNLR